MKSHIIPAQITTFEDTIIGTLTITQILVCMTPILLSSFVFILLPPFYVVTMTKIIYSVFVFLFIAPLAFRIHGKLLLLWLLLLIRYYQKPTFYVFDKSDIHLRPHNVVTTKRKTPIKQKEKVDKNTEIPTYPSIGFSLIASKKGAVNAFIYQT